MGRSANRRLILDPTAKRRILEKLLSKVRDMLSPAGMMDAGQTGDEAGAGSPRNADEVQPKAALEAAVTSQDGGGHSFMQVQGSGLDSKPLADTVPLSSTCSPWLKRTRKRSFKARTLESQGLTVWGSHKKLSKKRKKGRAEEGDDVEAGCLEDFMEVEVGERMLKKPCSESVGVEIIMSGSTVQTHPEP